MFPTGTLKTTMTQFCVCVFSSRQMAEEVIRGASSPGEGAADNSPGFEGMEALAKAIELVLSRVQITLTDTSVQISYKTPDQIQELFLKLTINRY